MKFCIDCKWCKKEDTYSTEYFCKHNFVSNLEIEYDVVTGQKITKFLTTCGVARHKNGKCGVNGKYWEKNE